MKPKSNIKGQTVILGAHSPVRKKSSSLERLMRGLINQAPVNGFKREQGELCTQVGGLELKQIWHYHNAQLKGEVFLVKNKSKAKQWLLPLDEKWKSILRLQTSQMSLAPNQQAYVYLIRARSHYESS